MKKSLNVFAAVICILLVMMCAVTAFAEEMSQEEADLRWLLTDLTGQEEFELFAYGDYDGDGVGEAFALVGYGTEYGYTGDIWFVSPYIAEPVLEGEKSFYYLLMDGAPGEAVCMAEEGYGGSGSTSHVWMVYEGFPYAIDVNAFGDMEYGGGTAFYAYPDAFDGCVDGSGHTWKRYYYYLEYDDGPVMKEYGGIYIELDQLLQYKGAAEIIEHAEAEGFTIEEIIYRANGIINVNMQDGWANDNVTLKIEGNSVVDLELEYGGRYELANTPDNATYPKEFPAAGQQ